jgi:esterase/lipase superfamily enzyme
MKNLTLYYATNRHHEGPDPLHPTSYGTKFSDDGMENLRFGKVVVSADETKIAAFMGSDSGFGKGQGDKLSDYLAERAKSALIEAFAEKLDKQTADIHQENAVLGSKALFSDIKLAMEKNTDVLIYIHGFNVDWSGAVGAALALQEMLNNSPVKDPAQNVLVVLFTWPSDGLALPFVSYKSDRTEAQGSGYAFGRGILKVRDFLTTLKRDGQANCNQDIHLLCHSMGNFVLQNTLERIDQFTPGPALPRIFEHIFLCAPDVDDNALESGQPMERLHEMARSVNVYYNRGDVAMYISDYTKGNPERLGTNGAARPSLLHNKVSQIDCSPVVKGVVEHSYYLCGNVNADIRASIDGVPTDDQQKRKRVRSDTLQNVWSMKQE